MEPDAKWHHMAVTWDGLDQGRTRVYYDGMLGESQLLASHSSFCTPPQDARLHAASERQSVALIVSTTAWCAVGEAITHKTRPLQPGGSLIIAGEQVCRMLGSSPGFPTIPPAQLVCVHFMLESQHCVGG